VGGGSETEKKYVKQNTKIDFDGAGVARAVAQSKALTISKPKRAQGGRKRKNPRKKKTRYSKKKIVSEVLGVNQREVELREK